MYILHLALKIIDDVLFKFLYNVNVRLLKYLSRCVFLNVKIIK